MDTLPSAAAICLIWRDWIRHSSDRWCDPRCGQGGFQALINSQYGRTVHYDYDEAEAMDETKGLVVASLPAEAVREVIVTRSLPEVFEPNAEGSVRLTTRSGGDEWHGNLFGNFRDRPVGLAGFPSEIRNTAGNNMASGRRR
jgi:hypothetical protein